MGLVREATDENIRARLGSTLVLISVIGVGILATTVLAAAAFVGGASAIEKASQLVFTAILPLLGTWVGTVLAFYYSRDNFEAANRVNQDLVRLVSPRLAATKVVQVMMPAQTVVKVKAPAGKTIGDIAIRDVDGSFRIKGANGQRISRLLITDSTGVCIGILHRSIWLEMLDSAAQGAVPIDRATDSLTALLLLGYESHAGTTFKDFTTKTLAFVAETQSTADAKAALEATPHCQDVIVTASGKATDLMRGWISNVDIARLSQAT